MIDINPYLLCPKDKQSMFYNIKNKTYCCNACKTEYKKEHGIPVLIDTNKLDDFKKIEQEFHNELSETKEVSRLDKRTEPFHIHFRAPLESLPKKSLILELGAGTRGDTLELAKSGHKTVITDISPNSLSVSKQIATDEQLESNTSFIAADAENLPFRDNTFSGCLMCASFHHLPKPELALKELSRVLKPGGYLILGVEPNTWPYYTIFPLLKPLKKYIRKKSNRKLNSIADDETFGFSKKQLQKMFENNKFKVEEIKPVKFTTEYYDSLQRLRTKLSNRSPQKTPSSLHQIDKTLEHIPLLNKLFWHWNVISTNKK